MRNDQPRLLFIACVVSFGAAISQFASADSTDSTYSDCSYNKQTAIAVPMPSSGCNGGAPVVACQVEATCGHAPNGRESEVGKREGWSCAGTMVDGVPTCPATANECVNDQTFVTTRTDRLLFGDRNSSAPAHKPRFRWRMPAALDRKMQPNAFWQLMIQLRPELAICNSRSPTPTPICYGTVDSTGFFENTIHPYCAGDRYGCPTADDCVDLYVHAVNLSKNRNAFFLAPLPEGIRTEPPPPVVADVALAPLSLSVYLVLALNGVLSWWNARTCGRAWVESKAVGGWIRFLVWCGAIQSAVGFSSVFLLPIVFTFHALFPDILTGTYVNGAISLWYLTVIIPMLGTGLSISIESWIRAYREQNLAALGVAAYNTFAQVHNLMGSIDTLQSAAKAVLDLFISVAKGKGDAKGKAMTLGLMAAVLAVVLALCAGGILTAILIHYYAGTVRFQAQPDLLQTESARAE
jgi:hypothetical protein